MAKNKKSRISVITTDVALIGAGPVGLFSLFECGMLGLSTHVFDPLPFVGGQCSALYPEKPLYDIPAYPQITAGNLILQLERQAAPFQPEYHLGEKIIKIEKGTEWRVEGDQGSVVHAKAILIAAGVGAFGPNRPPLDHIEAFEGTSVHYSVRHKHAYQGKSIVIAGGGDSAVDWAIELAPIASLVTLIHRRPKFRAAPGTLQKLHELKEQGRVCILTPFQLHAIHGKNGIMTSLDIMSLEGELKTLNADVLLPFFGMSMDLGPLCHWGLSLDKSHIQIDQGTCSTNIPGVYAIGDIATYPHKRKLILCGFSEAAYAAYAIRAYIHPGEAFHFEYSTTQGVPQM